MTTEDDAGPLYQRIADKLSDDIRSGALPIGAQLPTQRELAAEIGTTVGTIGRAYTLLEERELVIREVGRGTYVGQHVQGMMTSTTSAEKALILKKIGELEVQLAELRDLVKRL